MFTWELETEPMAEAELYGFPVVGAVKTLDAPSPSATGWASLLPSPVVFLPRSLEPVACPSGPLRRCHPVCLVSPNCSLFYYHFSAYLYVSSCCMPGSLLDSGNVQKQEWPLICRG